MPTTRLFTRTRDGKSLAPSAHLSPAVIVLLAVLTLVQLGGMTLAAVGHAPGALFSFTYEGLARYELWRIVSFPFSCFAEAGGSGLGAQLLASVLMYCFALSALLAAGVSVERRLGSLRMLGFVVAVSLLQAAFSIVIFNQTSAFSPVGMTLALVALSLSIDFEPRSAKRDDAAEHADVDFRLILLVFPALLVSVVAAFDAAFRPLLAGLVVGPICALCAWWGFRHREYVEYSRQTRTHEPEEPMDEELLTTAELRGMTDRLLDKISRDGINSLDSRQKAFLSRASQRLRQINDLEEGLE